jgi:hypothetical protein
MQFFTMLHIFFNKFLENINDKFLFCGDASLIIRCQISARLAATWKHQAGYPWLCRALIHSLVFTPPDISKGVPDRKSDANSILSVVFCKFLPPGLLLFNFWQDTQHLVVRQQNLTHWLQLFNTLYTGFREGRYHYTKHLK